ncbi:MAG TPA: DUF3307 domain-containing protein [Desulfosarcina sp.]|nr:DUF3307 domain-containing protein [Desulfosarcina sp.]
MIAHLVADWMLQTDWMARHKMNLKHPAGWIHAAIHGLCLTWALNWVAGLVLGVAHLLIDTRVPLEFWMRRVKMCKEAPNAAVIAVGLDQTMHVVCIAAWLALNG